MVSRGGRSRGCTNCRKRRVKCDEKRPSCEACKKRRLQCDGPKDVTWVNTQSSSSPLEFNHILSSGNVPQELALVAFEDNICLAYTRTHMVRRGNIELAYDKIQCQVGSSNDPSSPGLSLLRNAVLSLTALVFGSQTRQKTITNRGYAQYGHVLKQLNLHLTQVHMQTSNETLLTILLCMLVDILWPTGSNSFLKHAKGIEVLLAQRGPPQSCIDEAAFIIYNLRTMSIVGALAERRPSIWASETWKHLPPFHSDEGLVIRHDIFQILAECTVLMSDCDRMAAHVDSRKDYGSMLDDAHACLEALEAILPRWEKHNYGLLTEDTRGETTQEFRVADSATATTFMLYHATTICVLGVINSMDPSPKHTSRRMTAALKIVLCLELKGDEKGVGDPESNTIGPVATKSAWEVLKGCQFTEGLRLARIVKSSASGTFAVGAWECADIRADQTYSEAPDAGDKIRRSGSSPQSADKQSKERVPVRQFINVCMPGGRRERKGAWSPSDSPSTDNSITIGDDDVEVCESQLNGIPPGMMGVLRDREEMLNMDDFAGSRQHPMAGVRVDQSQPFGLPPDMMGDSMLRSDTYASLQKRIQTSLYDRAIGGRPWM